MGYPTDIFSSEPTDSCICAICHDVLKEASSLNCGHSFCTECIRSLYFNSSELSCPTCRTAVTGSTNPNYAVRGIIDTLDVSCPHGGDECSWKGKVGELNSHSSECLYKVIECSVEGCTHTCQRRDMAAHRSSYEALLQHMELKHERKMNEMEAKLSSRYDNKISELESEFKRRLIEMENTYEQYDEDRQAEIQSCKKKLRLYKNKVDTLEEKVHTLEEKVEVLEKQIWDKKRKKRKISSPVTNSEEASNDAPVFTPVKIRTKLETAILDVVKCCGAHTDAGTHVRDIIYQVSILGFNSTDIVEAIKNLENEGQIIYTTINE